MNLPEFSVKNSILGNMLTVLVIVVGSILLLTMQREVFPLVDLDLVIVTTRFQNASPQEVEDLITVPIEDEINDLDGIEEYTSTSVEGISVVVIQLEAENRFKDRIINDIQRKVDQINDLPDEAEEPEIEVVVLESPVIRLALSGDRSEEELRRYGEGLQDKLESIPGVGSVDQAGWRDPEIWVEVDPAKLHEQQVALQQIAEQIALRNVNLPGGKLKRGREELLIRTVGQFYTPAEIEEIVVRSNIDGKAVVVSDLGTVRATYEEGSRVTRVNGNPALILSVDKRASGDTISIADEVKRIVREEQARLDDVDISLLDDSSYYVKRRLKVLSSNGLIGMVLVLISLLVFLNTRTALVTAVGIPFSFLATLLVMSALGITINLMTMFALIIVLGMIVDDAIIVGENIYHYMEQGLSPRDAAIRGASEVMTPVVATVSTTIAAFLPLIFVPGTVGDFLQWIPIVVTLALLASLLEALLVLPCHVADFVRPVRHEVTVQNLKRKGGADVLLRFYEAAVRPLLKLRYVFLLLVLAVFAGSVVFSLTRQRVDIFPADLIDAFYIRLSTEPGTRLEETEAIAHRVEEVVSGLPEDELDDVVTYVGEQRDQHQRQASGSHFAQIDVYLHPQNERERLTVDIMNELRKVTADMPGIRRIEYEMVKPGPPVGKPIEIKVRGLEFATLRTIADEIKELLSEQTGVLDVQDDFEGGKKEIHVKVNEREAARFGLDVQSVARTLYTAVQGAEATDIRRGSDEVIVRVRLKEPERDDIQELSRLLIPNRQGRLIRLDQVARLEEHEGWPTISHFNGSRIVTVSASVDPEVTTIAEASRALEEQLRMIPERYPGYGLIRGGEWKESRELVMNLIAAFLLSILLIYTILAMQFNSFFQPLIILAAVPLGLVGVVIALYAHSMPISMMALMGMVGLSGVVVNDAIVLVTFINHERRRGVSTMEAIVESGKRRLRPILLTSLTTVTGLMPVIYGWGGYEPFIAPAAVALAYGLIFATVLTLFVVPAIYAVALDLRNLFRRKERRTS